MPFDDLRGFLERLESIPGEVRHIADPLDPEYEVGAVLSYLRKPGPAVFAESIKGYPDWRVIGNVLGTRQRVALALEVDQDRINSEYLKRWRNPMPPVEVSDAPVKEVKHIGDIDVTDILPVLTFHEKDGGAFISSGVCVARDEVTGSYHVGIHRMQVKGPNRLGIVILNPPLSNWYSRAESRGEALEIAVAIGLDPMILIGAIGHGQDKLAIAGGLRNKPVPMTPAETLDLMVPANAEIVLEGRVLPGIREPEGPFGEATGYYFDSVSPVLEVTAITHREHPIYNAISPIGPETETITALVSGSSISRRLAEMVDGFCDFAFVPGSFCFQGVLSIKKKSKAQSRRAGLMAMCLADRLKQVVVVDDDVDVSSSEDVAWALATRCRPEEDVMIMTGLPSYVLDPAARDDASGKVIIDATKPDGEVERFERIRPENNALSKAERIWAKESR